MSNNPQAFPGGTPARFDGAIAGGMTLRDWFAGQALAGLMVNVREPSEATAASCYCIADAMLTARSENPNG